jgi:hypothetical protein
MDSTPQEGLTVVCDVGCDITEILIFSPNGLRSVDIVAMGGNDLTITVPSVSGIINFTNAMDIAAAGVKGITLPHDAGATALDLLVEFAQGGPHAFCTGGGSYNATLNPAGPVAGSVLVVTFTNCINGSSGSPQTLNGNFMLTVDSISGIFSSDYTVETTISPINITSVESEDTNTLTNTTTGGTRFRRQSVSGNFTELSQSIITPTPASLTFSETESVITRVVGPFTLSDSVSSSGGYSYGAAGETVTVNSGSMMVSPGPTTASGFFMNILSGSGSRWACSQ